MLLEQWRRELTQHAPGLSVEVFKPIPKSGSREESTVVPSTAWSIAQCDVVLVTFDILRDEISLGSMSPITHVQVSSISVSAAVAAPLLTTTLPQWWRMVTDEAQTIKMGGSIMSVNIHKVNHWAVTGTPCSKQVGDIATSMYFLVAEPFCDASKETGPWEGMIQGIGRKEAAARDAMVNLFRTMMWRHSKADVEDEVVLPPLQERAVVVPMDVAERKWAPPLPPPRGHANPPRLRTPQAPSTASATTRCTPTCKRRFARN